MITNNLGKINANNGLGHFVTYMATQHAIETAKRYGICSITISNSNYHGASGYYSSLIANADLVGIVLSNSFPKVIPYNGQTPALGTNPFSFASPSSIEQEPLLIDMSTSEHAGSTIRKAEESGDKEIGQLYPFGGSKGFGLTLLVEILAGVLSGSGITHQVKSLYENFETGGNSGHFILAIDISRLMPLDEFTSRMQVLTSAITGPGNENVQLPGHNRWENLRASEAHGIKLCKSTIDTLTVLADEFGLSMENYG